MEEPIEVTLEITRVLEDLGIEYLVGGEYMHDLAAQMGVDDLLTRALRDAGLEP